MSGKPRNTPEEFNRIFTLVKEGKIKKKVAAQRLDMTPGNVTYHYKKWRTKCI